MVGTNDHLYGPARHRIVIAASCTTHCLVPVVTAYLEFDEAGRRLPSAHCDRLVDVVEDLMKFTLLTRDVAPYLAYRSSERKQSAEALSRRVNQVGLQRAPSPQRTADALWRPNSARTAWPH